MGGFGSGVWPRIGCKAKTGERLAFDIRYWKRQGWLRCGRMSFSDGAVVDVIPTVRLDDDEKGVSTVGTLGGPQEVAIINALGLYSLIMTSRTAAACRFRKWLGFTPTPEPLPEVL